MNVAGFEEAWASSIPIQIEEGLILRVASIPGLMILKLVAWSDRGRETDKDAADIHRLLTTYADAGNTDRLYENEMDLLESVGFNMHLAGAELLGRDVEHLCAPPVLALIRSVLETEQAFEPNQGHGAGIDGCRGQAFRRANTDFISFQPSTSMIISYAAHMTQLGPGLMTLMYCCVFFIVAIGCERPKSRFQTTDRWREISPGIPWAGTPSCSDYVNIFRHAT